MVKFTQAVILVICTVGSRANAQAASDSTQHKLAIKSYVDGYFSTYSNDLQQTEFQPFETVGARDNSLGVNVAQIGLHYNYDKVRANVTLHWGDIPQATWSGDFNEIQEANVGLRLADGLWLDAGFFRTHIGTESFLPKNNPLSNTAFATFNEPFYQAGARLSYDKWERWYMELWALNGYNSFVDNNDAKSVGVLVNYRFRESGTTTTSITYTNIYGRENPDDIAPKQNRFYQNIYLNQNWNDLWLLTIGLDHGFQTNSSLDNPTDAAHMFTALTTLRYQLNPRWSISTRGEVFTDPDGFIAGTTLSNKGEFSGITLYGISLGGEYRPVENAYLRAETRYTSASDELDIFIQDNSQTNTRWEVLFTMGLDLEKAFGW